MRIHIVGAGPSGMSVAWEILRKYPEYEVIIYEKKDEAGGSWWEPEGGRRDMHASRGLFKEAYINCRSIFREMGISWDEVFKRSANNEDDSYIMKNLKPKDYWALTSMSIRVLAQPEKYKRISLKDALGDVSPQGEAILSHITYVIDGVGWETMSAFELVSAFNQVGLSSRWTQNISGRTMGELMRKALEDKGARFVFNVELLDVDYYNEGYVAKFSDTTEISDGLLVLALDNEPAMKFLKDNWGKDAMGKLHSSTYSALTVMIDYDEETDIEFPGELITSLKTRWQIMASVASDNKTISCTMCNLMDEILTTPPGKLEEEVLSQLGLPEPKSIRVAWGAEWHQGRWYLHQSSGVLNMNGSLPFFGKCPDVAMVGMMSERYTPYTSLEAATEVGRNFCHSTFGTRKALRPFTIIQLILILLIILLVLLVYIKF